MIDHTKNILGPQIRKLRYARGWSQNGLAIKLQMSGLDTSREVLAQMEGRRHCITDKQIPHFARVLRVAVSELFTGLKNEKTICQKIVTKS